GPNIEYVREVLKSVRLTAQKEDYTEVDNLPDDYEFFKYQDCVNKNVESVMSHHVIHRYLDDHKQDYRFEVEPHPIEALQDRTCDNTKLGRVKGV
ncbi:MAG: hypothetical protein E7K67_14860, partial [Peptostreptococcaceae bacterium]|nr:hypothetical protein [Peptostreptococcaceae bacterium]